MSENFIELELKFRADHVKLADFQKIMENLKYNKKLQVSSFDHYFTKPGEKDNFIRFRNGLLPELTKKQKTNVNNNIQRIEVDLPLDKNRLKEETAKKFCELEGYTKETKLFKSCFIYWYGLVNYSYYIVYSANMEELGTFIEIEYNKDQLDNLLLPGAPMVLKSAAKNLETLDIYYDNKLKRSLYELYVK